MDTPVIYKASNITKTSFVANWQAVTEADKYYLDVSENANFSTFLSVYNAKKLTNNYEEITGLSDLSHYFFRVKAEDNPDTGTAESGTLSSLTDTDKVWTADQFVGMLVRITAGTGAGQLKEITANTADTLTAAFDTAPDATSVYEIADISGYSFVMEVVTGFHVAGMSIEFGNLVADLFNVQGITIEVSTDFNFQATIRENTGAKVNSAKCLIIQDGWTDKGTWNPNTDPDPSTPNEGDFYTISATGENGITGETEEFNTTDLLVYLDATWQIKYRRLIYSDASGVANLNVDYLVDNLFVVSKSGYETERQTINYVAGYHQYDIKLFPVKSVIHHQSGHAVNLKPEERENKFYE